MKKRYSTGIKNKLLTTFLLLCLAVSLSMQLIKIEPVYATEKTKVVVQENAMHSFHTEMQRESFWAAGRHWVFYADKIDSTSFYIKHTSSQTGASGTWSTGEIVTTFDFTSMIEPTTRYFAVALYHEENEPSDPNDDEWFVHYVRQGNSLSYNEYIYYRYGELQSNGAINWYTAEHTAIYQARLPNFLTISKINIAVDENNYAWITWNKKKSQTGLDAHSPMCAKNANGGSNYQGVWQTWATGHYNLEPSSLPYGAWNVLPVALSGSNMLFIHATNVFRHVYSKEWRPEGFQSKKWANNGSYEAWFGVTDPISAAYDRENSGKVYCSYGVEEPYYIVANIYNPATQSWENKDDEFELQATDHAPHRVAQVSIDDTSGDVYYIWSGYPDGYSVYYRKYQLSTETYNLRVTWYSVSPNVHAVTPTAYAHSGVGGEYIVCFDTDKTGSNYRVLFSSLEVESPPEPPEPPLDIGDVMYAYVKKTNGDANRELWFRKGSSSYLIFDMGVTSYAPSWYYNQRNVQIDSNKLLHVVWNWYKGGGDFDIYYTNSSDTGETWYYGEEIFAGEGYSSGSILIDAADRLHFVGRDNDDSKLYHTYRNMSSATWSAREEIWTDDDVYDAAVLTSDPSGTLYILYNSADATPDGAIYLANWTISDGVGSSSLTIVEDTGFEDAGWFNMDVDENGVVHIVYAHDVEVADQHPVYYTSVTDWVLDTPLMINQTANDLNNFYGLNILAREWGASLELDVCWRQNNQTDDSNLIVFRRYSGGSWLNEEYVSNHKPDDDFGFILSYDWIDEETWGIIQYLESDTNDYGTYYAERNGYANWAVSQDLDDTENLLAASYQVVNDKWEHLVETPEAPSGDDVPYMYWEYVSSEARWYYRVDGFSYQIATLTSDNDVDAKNSERLLFVDSDGNYHALLLTDPSGVEEVYYTNSTTYGYTWSTPVEIYDGITSSGFIDVSGAIDPDNNIHVLMKDSDDGDLVYGCRNAITEAWSSLADVDNNNVQISAMCVDLDNTVHVVFDSDDQDLEYRYKEEGASWSSPVKIADLDGDGEYAPAIDADENGDVYGTFSHDEAFDGFDLWGFNVTGGTPSSLYKLVDGSAQPVQYSQSIIVYGSTPIIELTYIHWDGSDEDIWYLLYNGTWQSPEKIMDSDAQYYLDYYAGITHLWGEVQQMATAVFMAYDDLGMGGMYCSFIAQRGSWDVNQDLPTHTNARRASLLWDKWNNFGQDVLGEVEIESFDTDATVIAGETHYLNLTIYHSTNRTDLDHLILALEGDIQIKWEYNLGYFLYSEEYDPNNYLELNVTDCSTTVIDNYRYEISFSCEFDSNWGAGNKDAVEGSPVAIPTYLTDGSYYDYEGEDDWFYFQPYSIWMGDFAASPTIYVDEYAFLNFTVYHSSGHGSLDQAIIRMSGSIQLRWRENGGSYLYDELADPSGYCTLDDSGSTTTVVDANTLLVAFKAKFTYGWGVGYKDVLLGASETPTYIREDGGTPEYYYAEEENWFYFQLYELWISDFDTASQIDAAIYYDFSFQIEHEHNRTDFESAFLCFEGGIQFRWRYNGGTFLYDEYADPSSYATLNVTASSTTEVDAYTYEVSFNAMFISGYGEGMKSVIDPTRVIDQFASIAYGTEDDWFMFNPSPPYVPPIIEQDLESQMWYMRSDTWTTHEILGYKLLPSQSEAMIEDIRSSGGTHTTSYAVRVWLVDADDNVYELTSGTPVATVSRTTDDEGYLTNTWNFTGDWENIVVSAIQINVYHRWDTDAWSLRRIFISKENLLYRLPESIWSFTYHVERAVSGGVTYSYFKFGDADHNSGVTFYYRKVSPFTSMLYYLKEGDIISFVFAPFTYHAGDLFYGFLVLFIAVTTYNRYEDIRPVIAIMWLCGGTGGIINVLLPSFAVNLAYLFIGVAIATTLWKLFR